MKIEIVTTEDTHECETCGCSMAEGGRVFVDDYLVLEKEPIAHCYNGQTYSYTELLILALEKMGHNITVDGQLCHISMADARENI